MKINVCRCVDKLKLTFVGAACAKKRKAVNAKATTKMTKTACKATKCEAHTRDEVGGNNSSPELGWRTSRKVEKDTNRTTVEQHE